jgi:hypothetical protein
MTSRLRVKESRLLCVPSKKNRENSELRLDPFTCYAARSAKDSPAFDPAGIPIADQFETEDVRVIAQLLAPNLIPFVRFCAELDMP